MIVYEEIFLYCVYDNNFDTMQKDVNEQLFPSTLLRFWRPGAERHMYSAEEDEDDIIIIMNLMMHYSKGI